MTSCRCSCSTRAACGPPPYVTAPCGVLLFSGGGARCGDPRTRRPAHRAARHHGRHTALACARVSAPRRSRGACATTRRKFETDRDVQAALEESGIRVLAVHDASVVPPEDLALRASARRRLARVRAVPRALARAAAARSRLPERYDFAPAEIASEGLPFPGGVRRARIRYRCRVSGAWREAKLAAFLEGPLLAVRRVTRNVPSAGETSDLSAELSFGLVSARQCGARRVQARVRSVPADRRDDVRSVVAALARDARLSSCSSAGITTRSTRLRCRRRCARFAFARSHPQLDAWRSGTTGFPLVDAGVRELRATGRMHPRVRAIAASFLCFDLGVDWRLGRDEWDQAPDRGRSGIGNGELAMGRGCGCGSCRLSAHLQSGEAGASLRSSRELRAQMDHRNLQRSPMRRSSNASTASRNLRFAAYSARGNIPTPILDHEAAARAFLARYRAEVAV